MRICLVGGALQGMEAAYLAKKAGYKTLVIDKRPDAPALSLADEYAVLDPIKSPEEALTFMNDCDAVLPTCENLKLLENLTALLCDYEGRYLFDIEAYRMSRSKIESNRIMSRLGVPIPKQWPNCGFPVVVKPSESSGSKGITVAKGEDTLSEGIAQIESAGGTPVIQEYLEGAGVSMEFVGNGKSFTGYVTTEVIVAKDYDCKKVYCHPKILPPELDRELRDIGIAISSELGLNGIMDLEALYTEKGLRVLEIDARMPSQTPAAVLGATGINLLEEMISQTGKKPRKGASIYEHFLVRKGTMESCGEGAFAHVREPRFEIGLFGADEMITDYAPGAEEWVFTMINRGKTLKDVLFKREVCLSRIMEEASLERFVDEGPEGSI